MLSRPASAPLIRSPTSFLTAPHTSRKTINTSLPANKRADPVTKFRLYNQAWKDNTFLRKGSSSNPDVVAIRERNKQKPEPSSKRSHPRVPSGQTLPTDKKRHELRWQIRAQMLQRS